MNTFGAEADRPAGPAQLPFKPTRPPPRRRLMAAPAPRRPSAARRRLVISKATGPRAGSVATHDLSATASAKNGTLHDLHARVRIGGA